VTGRIKIIDDNIDGSKAEVCKGSEFWIIRSMDSDGTADNCSLFGVNEQLTFEWIY
jgi:hypothetical protein